VACIGWKAVGLDVLAMDISGEEVEIRGVLDTVGGEHAPRSTALKPRDKSMVGRFMRTFWFTILGPLSHAQHVTGNA